MSVMPPKHARPARNWLLLLIATPAAVAVWSGWVALGAKCGFGLVQPLPGIVSWHLDTAITLPVGVEAYGAYALGVWLAAASAPPKARTFARWSAIGALTLGMLGQVIYHLLAAAHRTRAPWPVVVVVSCLPVVTLGFGAALTHLMRAPESASRERPESTPEVPPKSTPQEHPESAPEPLPESTPRALPESTPDVLPSVAESAPPEPPREHPGSTSGEPSRQDARSRRVRSPGTASTPRKPPVKEGRDMTVEEVADLAREKLGAVPVPSINAIRALAGIGQAKAKAARDLLEAGRITRAK